jgi:hypothetical protein
MSPSPDLRYQCLFAPAARRERVILFPSFEIPRAMGFSYVMVHRMRVVGSDLMVEINSGRILALLTAEGHVKGVAPDDQYWVEHRTLEISHQIRHSADVCPERTRPQQIETWTPQASWQSYEVPPTLYKKNSAAAR